jgi:hypothetical protein
MKHFDHLLKILFLVFNVIHDSVHQNVTSCGVTWFNKLVLETKTDKYNFKSAAIE